VASRLSVGILQIGEECRDCIREFGLYRWAQTGQDKVCKENDHAMDEVRYFCATILRRDRNINQIMGGNDSETVVY
jgi:hypothetical protein